MKKVIFSIGMLMSSSVFSEESWVIPTAGAGIGTMYGMVPPKGLYFFNESFGGAFNQYDHNGNKTGVKVDAFVSSPILYYATGLKFLNADYAIGISQPFSYTKLRIPNNSNNSNGGNWGFFNTTLYPLELSWKINDNLFIKSGVAIYTDKGTSYPGKPPSNGGVGSATGYWAIQPNIGLTWQENGWFYNAYLAYVSNFKNKSTDYLSGDLVSTEVSVLRNYGNWMVGLGAFYQKQIQSDSGSGANNVDCGSRNGCRAVDFGVSPTLSYQFDKVNLAFIYSQSLKTENNFGGSVYTFRISLPLTSNL